MNILQNNERITVTIEPIPGCTRKLQGTVLKVGATIGVTCPAYVLLDGDTIPVWVNSRQCMRIAHSAHSVAFRNFRTGKLELLHTIPMTESHARTIYNDVLDITGMEPILVQIDPDTLEIIALIQ